MFKSIVVAFDGSDYANRALEIASSLAGQMQVPLGIIHVIDSSHMQIPDEMRERLSLKSDGEAGRVQLFIDSFPEAKKKVASLVKELPRVS